MFQSYDFEDFLKNLERFALFLKKVSDTQYIDTT